ALGAWPGPDPRQGREPVGSAGRDRRLRPCGRRRRAGPSSNLQLRTRGSGVGCRAGRPNADLSTGPGPTPRRAPDGPLDGPLDGLRARSPWAGLVGRARGLGSWAGLVGWARGMGPAKPWARAPRRIRGPAVISGTPSGDDQDRGGDETGVRPPPALRPLARRPESGRAVD